MNARRASVQAFQARIRQWYARNGRDLPWRRTKDPYHIVVSEVMLQQTQVDRVIPKYRAFLRTFPTWEALAVAPLSAVLRAWSGLGYNRRAKHLRTLAQHVVGEHGGKLPRTEKELRALPGIGEYTAAAILTFAFRNRTAPQDTNITRVIRRYFLGAGEKPAPAIRRRVQQALPLRNTYAWNHGLMDFGALVCTAKNPQCAACPLREQCAAAPYFLSGSQEAPKRTARVPFRRTMRFLRGEILRRLLTQPYKEKAFIAFLRKETGFSRAEIIRALHMLSEESLIARTRGTVVIGEKP